MTRYRGEAVTFDVRLAPGVLAYLLPKLPHRLQQCAPVRGPLLVHLVDAPIEAGDGPREQCSDHGVDGCDRGHVRADDGAELIGGHDGFSVVARETTSRGTGYSPLIAAVGGRG